MKTDLTNLPIGGEVKMLDQIANGYKAYQVLAHAVELKLFDWLENNAPSTREDISSAMNLNGMFMRSYLQALMDMGMLARDDDRYRNTGTASAVLVSSSPRYQGGWLMGISAPHSKWSSLGNTLIKDASPKGSSPFNENRSHEPPRWRRGEDAG